MTILSLSVTLLVAMGLEHANAERMDPAQVASDDNKYTKQTTLKEDQMSIPPESPVSTASVQGAPSKKRNAPTTPIAITKENIEKAVATFCKLEKRVQKMEEAREKLQNNQKLLLSYFGEGAMPREVNRILQLKVNRSKLIPGEMNRLIARAHLYMAIKAMREAANAGQILHSAKMAGAVGAALWAFLETLLQAPTFASLNYSKASVGLYIDHCPGSQLLDEVAQFGLNDDGSWSIANPEHAERLRKLRENVVEMIGLGKELAERKVTKKRPASASRIDEDDVASKRAREDATSMDHHITQLVDPPTPRGGPASPLTSINLECKDELDPYLMKDDNGMPLSAPPEDGGDNSVDAIDLDLDI